MTGSSLAPIVIPIIAMITLFGWLAAVFYADSHPAHDSESRTSLSSAPQWPPSETGIAGPPSADDELGPGSGTADRGSTRPHR
jgi:hypothetical protein